MVVIAPGTPSPRWELYAGMPCWIELITSEPQRACEFYAGLFGWEYRTHHDPETGDHIIASLDGYPVASIRTAAAEQQPDWRLYLATADYTDTVRQAELLGAKVTVDRSHVPGIGTKVVMMGPGDAEFGLLQPEESWQFDVGLPGTLMWSELVAIKALAADQFAQQLFGYTAQQFGSAEHPSDYVVWYLGEESVLARVSMIREFITPATRPHWLIYLGADSTVGTDELVREAIILGGRVRVDPYDSSLGRIAVLRDPTGARFAIIDSTQAVGAYGSAANYDPYDD
jgi:uncharacterized protein